MNPLLDNLEYLNKPWYLSHADEVLFPFRNLLGGRTIQCVERGNNYTFRVPNSRDQSTGLETTTVKIIDIFRLLTTSPFILAASLAFKAITNDSHQKLIDRFEKTESQQINNFTENFADIIEEREILEDSWLMEKMTFFTEGPLYDELKQAAHILADKGMKNNILDYKPSPLTSYRGGNSVLSGRMLSQELSKYENDKIIGPNIVEAKKKIDEYTHWCSRFFGIISLRSFPIPSIEGVIKNLAIDIQNRIYRLKIGESFLIPITIKVSNAEEGREHVIVGNFIYQTENFYEFRIYNVGLGLKFHKRCDAQIVPFNIQKIPLNHITSIDHFLIPLIKLVTCETLDQDCALFYGFLESNLKTVVEEENFNKEMSRENNKKRQISGICSWKSPLAALKDSMPLILYKHFVLKMKRDKWWELYLKYHNNNDVSSSDQRDAELIIRLGQKQIKKIIVKFAKLINSDEESVFSSEFTPEQLSILHSTL
jgi:hypothetical protein